MSKYMQLKVSINPYYQKGFARAYPGISRRFSYLDEAWVEGNPSLFEIIGRLDKLLYKLEGDPPFRELLLKYRSALHKLYEDTEKEIGDWRLANADKLLYKMEDIFDEIEDELGKI
ncbi:MAG: hypothetical protein HWN68_16870 [Desulfobacterales bacterium]|nr:hypothetical protein [Desulfobacterales bacterium]